MSYDIFDIILDPHFPKSPSEDWRFLSSSSKQEVHSKLRKGRFSGGVWNDLDLSGLYFDYCSFGVTQLVSCNFYNARIKSDFNRCKCEDSNFSLAQFQRGDSMSTVFLRCSFIGSIWEKGYSFKHCLFYNCDLTDVVVDTDNRFLGTIFKKCLIPSEVAERLKMLESVILD